MKYGHANFTETCFHGRRLDILVAEDERYTRSKTKNDSKSHYSFNFILKPECSGEKCNCTSLTSDKFYSFQDGVLINLSLKIDSMIKKKHYDFN